MVIDPVVMAVKLPVAEMKTCAAGESSTPVAVLPTIPVAVTSAVAVASASAVCWAVERLPESMFASGMFTDVLVWPMLPLRSFGHQRDVIPGDIGRRDPDRGTDRGVHRHLGDGIRQRRPWSRSRSLPGSPPVLRSLDS